MNSERLERRANGRLYDSRGRHVIGPSARNSHKVAERKLERIALAERVARDPARQNEEK